MKFGVVLPNYGAETSRQVLVDTTCRAESLGFDSAWLTDHLALPEAEAGAYARIFETISALGYLAGMTTRIRLGISALVLPQRSPVEIARQIATIDQLSGGRLMLAAGVSWSAGEYAALGQSFANRGRRMDEALQVLRILWSGQRLVSFTGKFYNFDQLVFEPGPAQPGGPPLWIAGNSAAALDRAVRLGDGWHPNARTPEKLKAELGTVRDRLAGKPFTVCLRIRLQFGAASGPELPLAGTPVEIASQLEAYHSAGMDYAVLHFLAGSQGEREQAMRRFSREVMPRLVG